MCRPVAVLAVTLAAPPALAAAPAGEAPPLRLAWLDPTGVAATVAPVARAEAANHLARLGADVLWRNAAPGEYLREGEIEVVLLDSPGPLGSRGPVVLGATRRRFEVARVVWVRVPNVRGAVGVPAGGPMILLPTSDRLAVGVAIGRVVAHEVVHALVPSLPHGAGLMSSCLSRRQLTGGAVPVDPEAALAFRAALRGGPVFPAPAPGIVAYGPQALR